MVEGLSSPEPRRRACPRTADSRMKTCGTHLGLKFDQPNGIACNCAMATAIARGSRRAELGKLVLSIQAENPGKYMRAAIQNGAVGIISSWACFPVPNLGSTHRNAYVPDPRAVTAPFARRPVSSFRRWPPAMGRRGAGLRRSRGRVPWLASCPDRFAEASDSSTGSCCHRHSGPDG